MRNKLWAVGLSALSVCGMVSSANAQVVLSEDVVGVSCIEMTKGWEVDNNIELGADSNVTYVNGSQEPVYLLAKNTHGQFWQIVKLDPGASMGARMSHLTNLAWAKQAGDKIECVQGFSIADGQTLTYR